MEETYADTIASIKTALLHQMDNLSKYSNGNILKVYRKEQFNYKLVLFGKGSKHIFDISSGNAMNGSKVWIRQHVQITTTCGSLSITPVDKKADHCKYRQPRYSRLQTKLYY